MYNFLVLLSVENNVADIDAVSLAQGTYNCHNNFSNSTFPLHWYVQMFRLHNIQNRISFLSK